MSAGEIRVANPPAGMGEITAVAVVPGVRGASTPAFVEPLFLLLPPPLLLDPPEEEREEDPDPPAGALDFSVDFTAIERVDFAAVEVVGAVVLGLELLGLPVLLLLAGSRAGLVLLFLEAEFGDEVGVDSDPDPAPDSFISDAGVTGARANLVVSVPVKDGEAVFWVWLITVSTEAAMVGVVAAAMSTGADAIVAVAKGAADPAGRNIDPIGAKWLCCCCWSCWGGWIDSWYCCCCCCIWTGWEI